MPRKFVAMHFKHYARTTDLIDHVMQFHKLMELNQEIDAILCKILSTELEENMLT